MSPRRLAAATALTLALVAGAASARGQLQTRQTGVDLDAGDRAGRIVLANTGDAPVAAQVRVYAWTQVDGQDLLEPTDAMVASPPIMEIAAGGEQLVRVVRPTAAAVEREQAFRIVVDELPGPGEAETGSAIKVRMRYVLPAFVRAPDPAPASLDCRIEPGAMVCHNTGGRAAQLGRSHLLVAGGRKVELSPGLLGYVLAGSTRRFELDAPVMAVARSATQLEVLLDGQPATLPITRGH
ncbi:fimbrial biogenesis chaperone [Novilysobacter selenitireducens]|uniref:Fimbria/pilus periplasmic chaperone n=1 Tax=Novilysobacter selenitireducens TaxID=2872639 RepID=A0ABS7T229_9GAMM|nr:fimbria/pilus periplasmic chaperone [Lysobacter selenitireducens]MBZ4037923.1 fimbria/pilus periplasmic chaperone [Lysobacter selenitireducens]